MLVAAAAMAFVSCQKQEIDAQETFSATLTVNADVQTKTYLEDNAIFWGTGEAVELYLNDGEAKFITSASADQYEGQASAAFTFELNGINEAESYVIGGVYPASAVVSDNNNDATKYKVILPAIQYAEADKYDPSAFIMILKPETLNELPESHTASFRRAVALNKITLTGVKEDITSVEITVPAGKYLTGRRYFDLTAGTSGDIYYEKKNTLTVNSSYTGSSIDVWFTSWGVELAEGENLTVKMTSATGTYTRSIAARTGGIKFLEGDLNTLTINMTTSDYVANDDTDYSGQWLITGSNGDTIYAAKAYEASETNIKSLALSLEDGKFVAEENVESCKMFVSKVLEGNYKGKYTIQDINGMYLCSGTGTSSSLKGKATVDDGGYWSISICDDGSHKLVSSSTGSANVMMFNSKSNSLLFNCYASSSSMSQVTLYPYSMVAVGTTPEIVISSEEPIVVDAEAGEVTINYTIKNPVDNSAVQASADVAWLTDVQYTDGTVTYTVAENTGAERKATVTLSYEGATSVEVVITQAADAAPSSDVWALVTDASTLAVGDQIVIVASDYDFALSTEQKTNNRGQAAVVKSNSEVTFGADVQILTLRAGIKTNTWALDAGTGYLYAASSSENYMKTQINLNDNGSWIITIEEGVAKLCAQGTNTRNIMRYNSSSSLFSCYGSGQKDISIYKLQN